MPSYSIRKEGNLRVLKFFIGRVALQRRWEINAGREIRGRNWKQNLSLHEEERGGGRSEQFQ